MSVAAAVSAATNTRQLKDNLANHEAQLHQVEAALTNDPENEELLKLKADLTDVIDLTKDLMQLAPEPRKKKLDWKAGQPCEAVWLDDGRFHSAVIDMIADDGETCTVIFDGYGTTQIQKLSELRSRGWEDSDPLEEAAKKRRHGLQGGRNSKQRKTEMRELKKKKALKKQAKLQEVEDLREKEKDRWKVFTQRSAKQKGGPLGGKQKKSIFAVPDSIHGRVGVGTCNIGGQGMTDFSTPKNYTKPEEGGSGSHMPV